MVGERGGWRRLLIFHAVSFACCTCYLNSLDGDFVYDDGAAITKNGDVTGNSSKVWDLFLHDFWGQELQSNESHKSYRPFTTLTFRWNVLLFGKSAKSFHLINLFCHALVSALVGMLCFHVLGATDQGSGAETLERRKMIASGWCVALFATHPIHVEAVSNIVSRAELLCAFFFILGFFTYSSATRSSSFPLLILWLVGTNILFMLAILSKESGLTMMAFFFLFEATVPAHLVSRCRAFLRFSSVAITAAFYMYIKKALTKDSFFPNIAVIDNSVHHAPSSLSKVLSLCHIYTIYLFKLLAPIRLSCDYSRNVIANVLDFADYRNTFTFMALLMLCSVVVYAVSKLQQGCQTLLWCVSWLVFPFALSSNILFPVATVIGERLLYIPSIGFCCFLSFLYFKFTSDGEEKKISWHTLTRPTADAIFATICCLYATRTWFRNPVWKDNLTLFKEHVQIVPESVRMNHALALELARAERHQEAFKYFKETIRLVRDETFNVRIKTSEDENKTLAQYLFEAANCLSEFQASSPEVISLYNEAAALQPQDYKIHNRLAFAFVQSRKYAEGFEHFLTCWTLRPDNSDMINNLANIYMATHRPNEALRAYKLGQRLNPRDADGLYNMGVLLMRMPGKKRDAMYAFLKAYKLNPEDSHLKDAAGKILAHVAGAGGKRIKR